MAAVAVWLCAAAAPGGPRVDPTNDLIYVGAFRLPGPSGASSWSYSGKGLGYYPQGDPSGPADGATGSLFGVGHDWETYVSEITIPSPVVSTAKDVNALNAATTLQAFADIRAFDPGGSEQIYGDVEYLPAQGAQTNGKLHYTFGRHFQYDKCVSHGWCELVLTNCRSAGGWFVGPSSGPPSCFAINRYLFAIPADWAAAHTPSQRLATGRFREGGLSGQGPALFAIGPWTRGNPPATNTELDYTTLLKYDDPDDPDPTNTLDGYREADEWPGGAWLVTPAGKSAVVFVGTKATGDCWYGFSDGSRWPDCLPACEEFQDRGWWASGMYACAIFYDVDDLAAVAEGSTAPYLPQPYALLNLQPYLFRSHTANSKERLGGCAFDAGHGLLYVFEPFADEDDKPIVHVWKLKADPSFAISAGSPPALDLLLRDLTTNQPYSIESSSNLQPAAWGEAHSFTATGSTHAWTDLSPTSSSRRFYRLSD